jgi:hypothetical protein
MTQDEFNQEKWPNLKKMNFLYESQKQEHFQFIKREEINIHIYHY